MVAQRAAVVRQARQVEAAVALAKSSTAISSWWAKRARQRARAPASVSSSGRGRRGPPWESSSPGSRAGLATCSTGPGSRSGRSRAGGSSFAASAPRVRIRRQKSRTLAGPTSPAVCLCGCMARAG
jgi:hypothetical protein